MLVGVAVGLLVGVAVGLLVGLGLVGLIEGGLVLVVVVVAVVRLFSSEEDSIIVMALDEANEDSTVARLVGADEGWLVVTVVEVVLVVRVTGPSVTRMILKDTGAMDKGRRWGAFVGLSAGCSAGIVASD